ncbi:hypothetical protein [Streptomyces albidochromogenes]|uniref:Uncharacterized protein n=1 Tax=Streptomyces albidochromogenes TaxID=329524 RepID=A0ABW6FIH4_9ACTN
MRRDRISRLAEFRTRYTNETYQQAHSALHASLPPIPPAASDEQRNFEADIFDELLKCHARFTEYSFGVRRVHPQPDTIKLELESPQRGEDLLRQILPVYEPDLSEVHGLPGLRISERTKQGIELHISGRRTSVWLTGLPPAAWRRAENAVLRSTNELFWWPLWRGSDEWTVQEHASEERWNTGEWTRHIHAGAWCTSGLLRRLPSFHTIVPADVITGYKGLGVLGYDGIGPVRWVLDLDYSPGVPHYKDQLVEALTDPDFGLPLTPAHHLEQALGRPLPSNMVRLDDTARTSLIELRFSTGMHRAFAQQHQPQYEEIVERVRRIQQQHRTWPRGGQPLSPVSQS